MIQRFANRVFPSATLACAVLFILSACRIELCHGTSCTDSSAGDPPNAASGGAPSDNSLGGSGGAHSAGAAGATDPFAGADPGAVNRESVRASATMYLLQGTMEQTIAAQEHTVPADFETALLWPDSPDTPRDSAPNPSPKGSHDPLSAR